VAGAIVRLDGAMDLLFPAMSMAICDASRVAFTALSAPRLCPLICLFESGPCVEPTFGMCGHGLYCRTGRARGMGADPGFGDVCRVMTVSLQRNACFHWGEIREVLGERAYAGMQRQRGLERVWVVRHGGAGRGARGTVLDHAAVMESEDYGYAAIRNMLPHATSAARPGMPAHDAHGMRATGHEQWCRLGPGEAGAAGPGLVEEIVKSFQGAAALTVEEEVCDIMSSTVDEGFALVSHGGSAVRMAGNGRVALGAGMVSDAGAAIVRANPEVAFPQGIVAMVSPEQADQLREDATACMGAGKVHGIDVVTTPAIRYDEGIGGYAAIVAAKGSIRVSLSPMEIHASKEGGGVAIVARYGAGVAASPGKAAMVFSHRR